MDELKAAALQVFFVNEMKAIGTSQLAERVLETFESLEKEYEATNTKTSQLPLEDKDGRKVVEQKLVVRVAIEYLVELTTNRSVPRANFEARRERVEENRRRFKWNKLTDKVPEMENLFHVGIVEKGSLGLPQSSSQLTDSETQ